MTNACHSDLVSAVKRARELFATPGIDGADLAIVGLTRGTDNGTIYRVGAVSFKLIEITDSTRRAVLVNEHGEPSRRAVYYLGAVVSYSGSAYDTHYYWVKGDEGEQFLRLKPQTYVGMQLEAVADTAVPEYMLVKFADDVLAAL